MALTQEQREQNIAELAAMFVPIEAKLEQADILANNLSDISVFPTEMLQHLLDLGAYLTERFATLKALDDQVCAKIQAELDNRANS